MFLRLLLVFIFSMGSAAQREGNKAAGSHIEGAYELISDNLTVGTLDKKVIARDRRDWSGIWIFRDGFYSQTTMKKGRSAWVSRFPRDGRELGYLSCAGSYTIDGKYLILRETLSLFPESTNRPGHYEYRIDGDTVTLRESWEASVERTMPGERIIVLKKSVLKKR